MHCHTLSGCSYANTSTVTVLAACVCACENACLRVRFCPRVMSKYINHAASSLTHMFVYLDDHLVTRVRTCARGAVNQMSPCSMLVLAEMVCVLGKVSGV